MMVPEITQASEWQRERWLEIIVDHLYTIADILEEHPVIEDDYVSQEIKDVWRTAYALAYIWGCSDEHPLTGHDGHLDDSTDDYWSCQLDGYRGKKDVDLRIAHLYGLDSEQTNGILQTISAACLDLAQSLDFTFNYMKIELREAKRQELIKMTREIADISVIDYRENTTAGIFIP